jgi:acyl-coenzyme A synthetase/AMP-(fatty) acid ligase
MSKRPPRNIGLLFDWHAAKSRTTELYLDQPFEIDPNGGVLYDASALARLVNEASGWLYAAGARRGDRVAVIKRNHFDMIVLSAAAARIGAVAATISEANRPAHLVELLTRLSPAVTLISSGKLAEAQGQGIDLAGFGRTVVIDNDHEIPAGCVTLDKLRGEPVPATDIRPDGELMMITHTSGTTSTPKLVVHTADSNRAGTRLELLPMPGAVNRRDDVGLSSISFAHSRAYAWAFAQFRWAPRRLVIASSYAIADVERVFESERPTTVEAMPNVYQHWLPLVRRRPELFGQVRYYMNTFDMMHPSIARPFMQASKRRGLMWVHSWGQSEVGPIAGAPYYRWQLNRLAGRDNDNMNIMGWPWLGLIKAKVVDPDTGRRRRPGKVGVMMVKSKSLCIDYLGETDRYLAKRSGDWWNTGDVGFKDIAGRIHFLDRAVDAIHGGSATAIESALLQRLENALEVVVLTSGDLPALPVVSMADNALAADDWARATRGLPAMEQPVLMPLEDLPRTSTWKIRRKELRETVFAETTDGTVLDERFT